MLCIPSLLCQLSFSLLQVIFLTFFILKNAGYGKVVRIVNKYPYPHLGHHLLMFCYILSLLLSFFSFLFFFLSLSSFFLYLSIYLSIIYHHLSFPKTLNHETVTWRYCHPSYLSIQRVCPLEQDQDDDMGDSWGVPPTMHTQNAQLHTAIPPEGNPETSWVTPTQGVKWGNIPEWVGKAEPCSHHESHPQHRAVQFRGSPRSQPLPAEWRIWPTLQVPQLLRLPHQGWIPKTPSSKPTSLIPMSPTGLQQRSSF